MNVISYLLWFIIFAIVVFFALIGIGAFRLVWTVEKHKDKYDSKEAVNRKAERMLNCAAMNAHLMTRTFKMGIMAVVIILYLMICETETLYDKS